MYLEQSIALKLYPFILYLQLSLNTISGCLILYAIVKKSPKEMVDLKWQYIIKVLNGWLFNLSVSLCQPVILSSPTVIFFNLGITKYSSKTVVLVILELFILSFAFNALLIVYQLLYRCIKVIPLATVQSHFSNPRNQTLHMIWFCLLIIPIPIYFLNAALLNETTSRCRFFLY